MYTASDEMQQRLQRTFNYHPPKGNQTLRYEQLRAKVRDLAYYVVHNTPPSREQSITLTCLEEAVMFANAAIARNEVWADNQMLSPLNLSYVPPK